VPAQDLDPESAARIRIGDPVLVECDPRKPRDRADTDHERDGVLRRGITGPARPALDPVTWRSPAAHHPEVTAGHHPEVTRGAPLEHAIH
jgi:hypothetical protein